MHAVETCRLAPAPDYISVQCDNRLSLGVPCRGGVWVSHQAEGRSGTGCGLGIHPPGSLLTSHVSCFLEMLVQLRSRLTGCLLMMPLSAWGTMALHLLKSIFVQSLLSQHLCQKGRS